MHIKELFAEETAGAFNYGKAMGRAPSKGCKSSLFSTLQSQSSLSNTSRLSVRMLFSVAFFKGPWKDNGASMHDYKFYKGFAGSILVCASSTQLRLQHQLRASGLKKQRGHQINYAPSSIA